MQGFAPTGEAEAPFRVAVFGLGKVAQDIHLPACASLPNVEVVAACEPSAERRQQIGKQFGIADLYADPEAAFAGAKPDVAIIGTPPDSHRDLCMMALAHGAHVFCEKPFVSDLEQAREVLDAAAARNLHVRVNNQYRHMNIYRVPKERLDSGDFGRAYFIQCWQQMHHPPSNEGNWRAALLQSTLFEFGTHALDLICHFFDALPVSVNAHMPRPMPGVEADVVVQLAMQFPGDRLATLALNRISHAPRRYLEMRMDCEKASLRISLGGVARVSSEWARGQSLPRTRWSLVRGGEARVEAAGRSRVIAREWRPAFASATAAHLGDFLRNLPEPETRLGSGERARDMLRIVFAGYESAQSGETVWLT